MSNARRLRKPKKKVCRQCAAGNHTGHQHQVCPACEGRIEPGKPHLCIPGIQRSAGRCCPQGR